MSVSNSSPRSSSTGGLGGWSHVNLVPRVFLLKYHVLVFNEVEPMADRFVRGSIGTVPLEFGYIELPSPCI